MEKYIKLIDDSNLDTIMIELRQDLFKKIFIIDGFSMYYFVYFKNSCNDILRCSYFIILHLCLKKYNKIFTDKIKMEKYEKKLIIVAWTITSCISKSKIFTLDHINKILFNVYNIKFDDGALRGGELATTNSIKNIKLKNETSLYEYIWNDLNYNKDYIIEKAQNLYKKKETNTDVDIKLLIKPNNSIETVKKFISYINNLSLVCNNKNKIKIYIAKIKTKIGKNHKTKS